MTFPLPKGLTYAELREKHRELGDGFPENLSLRMRRAISWLERAERETADPDAAFIFYWIAFNAAYAADINTYQSAERHRFDDYFRQLISLDAGRLIHNAIWDRFSGPIRLLMENQYVFQPFWDYQNRVPGSDEHWEMQFDSSIARIQNALTGRDTRLVLNPLFDRLYVLRNQLVHGGATWRSSVNRDQVRDGARIMAFLVPIFIDLMLEHPEIDWGPPYYQVVR